MIEGGREPALGDMAKFAFVSGGDVFLVFTFCGDPVVAVEAGGSDLVMVEGR